MRRRVVCFAAVRALVTRLFAISLFLLPVGACSWVRDFDGYGVLDSGVPQDGDASFADEDADATDKPSPSDANDSTDGDGGESKDKDSSTPSVDASASSLDAMIDAASDATPNASDAGCSRDAGFACDQGERECTPTGQPRHCGPSCEWVADDACKATELCRQGSCQERASCKDLAASCGPNGNLACCYALPVPGLSFLMGSGGVNDSFADAGADEQPEHLAQVSAFALDEFPVTVARFRKYVEAYPSAPPESGAGRHPRIEGSGWESGWNGNLAPSAATLASRSKCSSTFSSWTDLPVDAASEARPINCVDWYQAFAFCIWDGGRLPTEAEWELAAAGADQDRLYPWGPSAPTNALAAFGCTWFGGTECTKEDLPRVGSAILGIGRYRHLDLVSPLRQWTLDFYNALWYQTGGSSCVDCANLAQGNTQRVARGGAFSIAANLLRVAARTASNPQSRYDTVGVRCAHDL